MPNVNIGTGCFAWAYATLNLTCSTVTWYHGWKSLFSCVWKNISPRFQMWILVYTLTIHNFFWLVKTPLLELEQPFVYKLKSNWLDIKGRYHFPFGISYLCLTIYCSFVHVCSKLLHTLLIIKVIVIITIYNVTVKDE